MGILRANRFLLTGLLGAGVLLGVAYSLNVPEGRPLAAEKPKSLDLAKRSTNLDYRRSANPSVSAAFKPKASSIDRRTQENSAAWTLLDDWSVRVRFGQPIDVDELRRGLVALGQDDDITLDAIRDFLSLTDPTDAHLAELRLALIEYAIETDAAGFEDLAFETLQNGTNTNEISTLGRYLERQQPGVYTDLIRQLAEEHLLSAMDSEPLSGDFFQLLGEVGNESTSLLLVDVPIQFNAYARVALAILQDGSGIAALHRIAQPNISGQTTFLGRIALELLAQQSLTQPSALSSLLDLAANGSIPDDLWVNLTGMISGKTYITLVEPSGVSSGHTTIYGQAGNQTLYRVRRSVLTEDSDTTDQRLLVLEFLQHLAPASSSEVFIAASQWLAVHRVSLTVMSIPPSSHRTAGNYSPTGD